MELDTMSCKDDEELHSEMKGRRKKLNSILRVFFSEYKRNPSYSDGTTAEIIFIINSVEHHFCGSPGFFLAQKWYPTEKN